MKYFQVYIYLIFILYGCVFKDKIPMDEETLSWLTPYQRGDSLFFVSEKGDPAVRDTFVVTSKEVFQPDRSLELGLGDHNESWGYGIIIIDKISNGKTLCENYYSVGQTYEQGATISIYLLNACNTSSFLGMPLDSLPQISRITPQGSTSQTLIVPLYGLTKPQQESDNKRASCTIWDQRDGLISYQLEDEQWFDLDSIAFMSIELTGLNPYNDFIGWLRKYYR